MSSVQSQLWRGVVRDFDGKYLMEFVIRGTSASECHQLLRDRFDKFFGNRQGVSLCASQLVASGPEIALASGRGHGDSQALLSTASLWPVAAPELTREPRSVPVGLRYR